MGKVQKKTKKKMTKRKRRILRSIFDYKEVSEEVVRLLLGSKNYAHETVKDFIERKYIKRRNRKIDPKKNKEHRYILDNLYLTKNGIQEVLKWDEVNNKLRPHSKEYIKRLMMQMSEEEKKENDESEESKKKKNTSSSNTTLEHKSRKADSVLMCCVAGMVGYKKYGYPELYHYHDLSYGYPDINPFLHVYFDPMGYLTEEQREANRQYYKNVNRERINELKERFGIVYSIDDIRQYHRLTTQDVNHLNFVSATGVLFGKYAPFMLYHAGHGFLSITKGGEGNLSRKIALQLFSLGIYKPDKEEALENRKIKKAIIFVTNKVALKRLVQNKYDVSYEGFEEFFDVYIIPTTHNGVEFLKLISQERDFKHHVLNLAKNYGYTEITDGVSTLAGMHLQTSDGIPVYYGINMDMNELVRLYKNYKDNGLLFQVICLDWQREYYESIFHEGIQCLEIPMNGIKNLLSKRQN